MTSASASGAPAIPRRSLPEMLHTVEERFLFHREKSEAHVRVFKPIGFIFGLAIPLLSALVTFGLSNDAVVPSAATTAMGLLLTLLTIVNAVLKPDKRFAAAVQHCIALHEWKRDFDIRVAESDAADEKAFHELIQEMDGRLSEIGRAMAEGWVPKAAE
jgi:hypothetical protein